MVRILSEYSFRMTTFTFVTLHYFFNAGESGEHGNSSPDHDLDGLLSISKKQKGDYEDSVAITSASTISQR